jgi:hypothetical protein
MTQMQPIFEDHIVGNQRLSAFHWQNCKDSGIRMIPVAGGNQAMLTRNAHGQRRTGGQQNNEHSTHLAVIRAGKPHFSALPNKIA